MESMTDSHAPKTAPDSREEATLREATLRQEAARRLGQATSERKAAAVRENGKKGGRPAGSRNSAASKARMRDAQRQRRAGEHQEQSGSRSEDSEKN